MPREFSKALELHPELINYGKYAMQASAWLEQFPRENLLVLIFEEFIQDRTAALNRCVSFLDLPFMPDIQIDEDCVYNASSEAVVLREGFLKSFQNHMVYRRLVRPLFSLDMRQRLQRLLLPKLPPKPPAPSREIVQFMWGQFQEDVESLQALLQRDQPPWNLEKTVAQFD